MMHSTMNMNFDVDGEDGAQYYLEKCVKGPITRPMQEMLQKEWEALSPEQQAVTRSRRARQGIKCEDCGRVGYFRRNCPDCPEVKLNFKTNEWKLVIPKVQLNTTGDKGVFWRPLPESYEETQALVPFWSDDSIVESQTARNSSSHSASRMSQEEELDAPGGPWYHYRQATDEPVDASISPRSLSLRRRRRKILPTTEEFHANSMAEQNLHLVLERLVQLIREQLLQVIQPFKETANRVPDKPVANKYYSDYTWQQYKDFFDKEINVPPKQIQNHKFTQGYRTEDEVAYPFDRSGIKGKPSRAKYYQQKPKVKPSGSIHSTTKWLPVTTKQERVYVPQPFHEKMEKALSASIQKQGKWVKVQAKAMQNRRKICNHLLHVLTEELTKEEKRQLEVLKLKGRQMKKRIVEIVEERSEAADRIINVLTEYDMLTGSEKAEYLLYTLNIIRDSGGVSKTSFQKQDSKSSAKTSNERRPLRAITPVKEEETRRIYETSIENAREAHRRSSLLSLASRNSSIANTVARNLSHQKVKFALSDSEHSTFMGTSPVTAEIGGQEMSNSQHWELMEDNKSAPSHLTGEIIRFASGRALAQSQSTPNVKTKFPMESCIATINEAAPQEDARNMTIPAGDAFASVEGALGYFRDGSSQDNTKTPAVIPIPDAYTLNDLPTDDKMPYVAEKTFPEAQKHHVHPVTGKRYEHDVVLWHRMTAESSKRGGKKYSELLNRPYSHFLPKENN